MRGYSLTSAWYPRCTTIYWLYQPKRQTESLLLAPRHEKNYGTSSIMGE
jgi:hypothetical protein